MPSHPPTIRINGSVLPCEFDATGNNVVVLDDLRIVWGRDTLYDPTNPSELYLELIDPTGGYSSDPALYGSPITVETDLGMLFRGRIDGITVAPEEIADPNPAVPVDVWRVSISASDVIAELARTVAPGFEDPTYSVPEWAALVRSKYGPGYWKLANSETRRAEIRTRMDLLGIPTKVHTTDFATISPPGVPYTKWFREGHRRGGEDLYTLIQSVQMRSDTVIHTNYHPGTDTLSAGRFARSAAVILTYRGSVIRAEIDPAAGYGFTVDCSLIEVSGDDGVFSPVEHNVGSLRITQSDYSPKTEIVGGAQYGIAQWEPSDLEFKVGSGNARTQYDLGPVEIGNYNVPYSGDNGVYTQSQRAADLAAIVSPIVASVNGKLTPPEFTFDLEANTFDAALVAALLATWTPDVPFLFAGARYEALTGWGPLFQLLGGELRFQQGWRIATRFAPSPPDAAAGNLPINQLVTTDPPTFDQYAGSVRLATLGIVTRGI